MSSTNPNQFKLLGKQRFLPFFLTQSLGALNDNIYKNALLITIAFSGVDAIRSNAGILANVASILFILPFFLFSPIFGQLADKFEKSRSIRLIKISEIIIIVIAILALQTANIYFLMAILFLLGIQSAAFGPIKYSILPQHLDRSELTGGNGLVETGTFLAILLGTLLGGVLIAQSLDYPYALPLVLTAVAVAGFLSSLRIPKSPAPSPNLKINWNPITQIYKTIGYVRQQKSVLQSVIGVSWFWFYGSVLLTQLPNYTRTTLGGDESVTTIVLMAFSIGVGAGSMFCNKLSSGRIEPGLVPIGAFGLSLFTLHLYFGNQNSGLTSTMAAAEFVTELGGLRILFDISMIGFFGGIYVVPLYSIIQNRADPSRLSRIISGSNILDALFIVLSGVFAIGLISLDLTVPEIFLTISIVNILVALYIFKQVPEFIFRLIAWLCTRTWYKLQVQKLENVPKDDGCILYAENSSFNEALVLASCLKRTARFIFVQDNQPSTFLSSLFTLSGAVIVTNQTTHGIDSAKKAMQNTLEKGNIVCVFNAQHSSRKGEKTAASHALGSYVESLQYPLVPVFISAVNPDEPQTNSSAATLPSVFSGRLQVVSGKLMNTKN